MDLASVVAALASVGVRVSGSTPNNNIQGDSSRACSTGLAGPEPSGTLNDPGQHFHIAVPEGTYARIAPRSGLAWRHHLQVGNPVTGPGYRGNVAVVLFNHATEDFKISRGDQVAQLVPKVVQVLGLPARPVYSPDGRTALHTRFQHWMCVWLVRLQFWMRCVFW